MAIEQAYTLRTSEKTLPVREDKDLNDMIRQICLRGMKQRGLEGKTEYEERLEEELELITRKEFPVYFIILWDALRFCRKNGILVGRGRGSSAGSLVCYLMEITDVDPIEYNLLFWRFLSDWRADWPDIDTDISDRDRWRLKKYLEEKYGADKVASITTFIFYSAKSAIKDACRVLAVPYKESNDIVTDIETMDDFRSVKYKAFHQKYPGVYQLAKAIDGRLKTVGYHAAATVITDMPITDLTSLESRKLEGSDLRQQVISLPKDDAEELGFIKYDFLGLKTLTVVSDCVESVKKNYNRFIDLRNMKFDDPSVLKMISDGNTIGVFQAEASASTKVIKDMGIDNFMDLVASNALVRPGAWKVMGPEYIAKKKGHKKVTYLPGTEQFLAETYGEVLYQEQMLLLCTEVAGLTKEEADKIRKLTAKKKDKTELAPFREKFIKGASRHITVNQAEKLWNDIETTAEYQFNKCLASDTKVRIMGARERGGFETTATVEEFYNLVNNNSDVTFYVLGPEYIKRGSTGGEKWYEVKGVYDNDVKDIVRVWINENWYIDSTFDHKHRMSKGWKEASRIHQMDRIATDQGMQTVWKKTWEGQAQTFDIELAEEPHAFFANGFVTHNSHSVAYSQLSYITAMLKYYYPAEYMCALLNNEKDAGSLSDYLSECKRLGIPVKTPDVNKSGMHYEVKDGVIYMGLANVKFISDKLAERLINLRPFKNYQDFRDQVMAKGSGLNSRVIDALNKVGATKFPDHPIDEQACKEFYFEYLGIASFDNAQITTKMRERLTPLDEYEDKSNAIIAAIVRDIVSKNGWIRVDFVDDSGAGGFFVSEDHGFVKGKKYLVAVAGGSVVGSLDLSSFNSENAIVQYLNGNYKEDSWFIAAKRRFTKTGKETATMLFCKDGRLNSANIWSDMLPHARRCRPGDKIRVKVKSDAKWGNTLLAILKDEK